MFSVRGNTPLADKFQICISLDADRTSPPSSFGGLGAAQVAPFFYSLKIDGVLLYPGVDFYVGSTRSGLISLFSEN
jgi:hypothetical protein